MKTPDFNMAFPLFPDVFVESVLAALEPPNSWKTVFFLSRRLVSARQTARLAALDPTVNIFLFQNTLFSNRLASDIPRIQRSTITIYTTYIYTTHTSTTGNRVPFLTCLVFTDAAILFFYPFPIRRAAYLCSPAPKETTAQ